MLSFCLFAETEGEKLFKENKPEKAVLSLGNEIKKGNITSNSYNFMGLAYFQLENYEKSVEAFLEGLKIEGVNKAVLYFNLGNSYFMLQKLEEAISSYEKGIEIDKKYSSAYLNKANCEVSTGLYEKAIGDYEEFLRLEPEDVQRPQIEALIKLLREEVRLQKEKEHLAELQRRAEEEAEMAAMVQMISDEIENDLEVLAKRDEEERRKLEEARKAELENEKVEEQIDLTQAVEEDSMLEQAIEIENQRVQKKREEEQKQRELAEEIERQKQAEEELKKQKSEEESTTSETSKKAESERRRKLLEDIANSLQTSDDQNITSGSGDIVEYEYESELE